MPVESKTAIRAGLEQIIDESDDPALRGEEHGEQQICQR
jgi:hypothetical protein